MDFIRLDASDNVVTATHALEAGTIIEDLRTMGLIPSGHKIATLLRQTLLGCPTYFCMQTCLQQTLHHEKLQLAEFVPEN